MTTGDGRLHAPVLTATVAPRADASGASELVDLVSPMVGWWHPQVAPGQLVQAGEAVGELRVLGVVYRVLAGVGARGAVVASGAGARLVAVSHGQPLVTLDARAVEASGDSAAHGASAATASGDLTIRAPSSGRFYGRPGPGKPPFVAVGDTVRTGQTVGLLEVMKSFHRVTVGDELPPGARVTAIVVADDADVDAGAVLFRLEAGA